MRIFEIFITGGPSFKSHILSEANLGIYKLLNNCELILNLDLIHRYNNNLLNNKKEDGALPQKDIIIEKDIGKIKSYKNLIKENIIKDLNFFNSIPKSTNIIHKNFNEYTYYGIYRKTRCLIPYEYTYTLIFVLNIKSVLNNEINCHIK